jgi:hypothetical protein
MGAALVALGLLLAPPAQAKQGHMRRAVDLLLEAKKTVTAASFSDAKHKETALDAIQRALVQTRRGIEAGLADEDSDESDD